jgi:hypothetical protein
LRHDGAYARFYMLQFAGEPAKARASA